MSVFEEESAKRDWIGFLAELNGWTDTAQNRKIKLRTLLYPYVQCSAIRTFLDQTDFQGGDVPVAEATYSALSQLPEIRPGILAPLAFLEALSEAQTGFSQRQRSQVLLLSGRVSQHAPNLAPTRVREAFEVAMAVLPGTFPLNPDLKPSTGYGVYACLKLLSGLSIPMELACRVGAFLWALDFDWYRDGSDRQRWFEQYLEYHRGTGEKIGLAEIQEKLSNFKTVVSQMQEKLKDGEIPVLAVVVDAADPADMASTKRKSRLTATLYRHVSILDGTGWPILDQYRDTDPVEYQVEGVDLTAFSAQDGPADMQTESAELSGLRQWLKSALWKALNDITSNRSIRAFFEADGKSNVHIEFFLQERLLEMPVDTWKIFDPALSVRDLVSYHKRNKPVPQIPLGQKYYVVIRSRDRLDQEIYNRGKDLSPWEKEMRLKTFDPYLFPEVPSAESFFNTMAIADNTEKSIFVCGKTVYRHDQDLWDAVNRSYLPFGIWARSLQQAESQPVGNDLSVLWIPPVSSALELTRRVWGLRSEIFAGLHPRLAAGISLLYDYYKNTSSLLPIDMDAIGDTVG